MKRALLNLHRVAMSTRQLLPVFLLILVSLSVNAQCPPIVIATPASASVCAGDSVIMQCTPSTGTTWQWYRNGIIIPGATNSSTYVFADGSYTVITGACPFPSNPVAVTIKPVPSITLSSSALELCFGQQVTLSVTTAPTVSWVWVNPMTLFGLNTNPITQTPTVSTIYQVVGVDLVSNCANTTAIPIVVNPVLTPGTLLSDAQICVGATPPLITSTPATGGNGTYTYQWQISTTSAAAGFSNIAGAVGTTYQPGPTAVTTWYRLVTSSPPCPDELSNVVVVQVNQFPVITSSATHSICSGNNVNYTPTSNVAGATFSWTASLTSGTVAGFSPVGTGNISNVLTLPAGSTTPGVVTYVITPTGPAPSSCPGTPFSVAVTVNPLPLVTNAILSQSICAGTSTTPVVILANLASTTFTWTATASAGLSGYTGSGSGNIPAMLVSSTLPVAGTINYTITPTGPAPNNCTGPSVVYTITVNSAPAVTNSPLQQTVCSGVASGAVTLTSNIPATTFTWTSSATPVGVTGFQVSGTNTIPAQTITNTANVQGVVSYAVIPNPSLNGCAGIPATYTIFVNPRPVLTATPGSQTICSGAATSIALTSNVAGTTYNWTSSAPGSILGHSGGSGNNITQVLTNTSNAPHDVTYVITPVSNGCTGTPVSVIVTVIPAPVLTVVPAAPVVCSGNNVIINLVGNIPGITFTWTASAVGNVTGFSNGSGATISQTLVNNDNVTRTVVYAVFMTLNGCTSAATNFNVTVYPVSTITNSPLLATSCSGSAFNLAMTSNVAGATYSWTANGTPGILGFAGGNGATINQILVNTTNFPGTVVYTITPTANGCVGTPSDYTVTINPVPNAVPSLATQSICSGTVTSAVTLSSAVAGTTYSWTATPSGAGITGYTASGTASIPAQTINNNLSTQGTVIYTITPTFNGCIGSNANHTVTINPRPQVTNASMSQTICSGSNSSNVNLISNVAGTNFTWIATPSSAAISGFIPSGGNTIPLQTIFNSSSTPGTVTYQVIPTSNFGPACAGTSADYIINIDPLPVITSSVNEAVCSGQAFTYNITSNQPGSSFTWSRAAVAGISNASSSGASAAINETLINTTSSDISVQYLLTPIGQAPSLCTGSSGILNLLVRALPQVNAGIDLTIPYGTFTTLNGSASGGTGALNYSWTPVSYISSGSNTLTPQTDNLNTTRTYTLTIDDAAGCTSADQMTVFVVGTPLAAMPSAAPANICVGESTLLAANASGGSGTYTYTWSSNPAGFSATNASITVSPAVTTIYTVLVDDGFNAATSSVTVTVNPLPAQYSLTGGGSYCIGGTGVVVGLANSQSGVSYQLNNNGTPVGIPVLGTGAALSFGNQTSAGTYTVTATRISTACNLDMGSSVIIVINSLPIANAGVDQIIPYGTNTTLNGSVSGGSGAMNYSWNPIAFIASGGNTAFPATTNIYSNTTFSLTVTDANGCSGSDLVNVSLSGSAINVIASATPGQICADTSQAQLNSLVTGGAGTYTYMWTCSPAGSPVWSSTLPNPMISPDESTTYTVEVNDGFNTAIASVNVVVNPLPLQYSVTGGGDYCFAGSGVNIGLSGSQPNTNYQLYRGGVPDGAAVTGTGSPISFGNRTAAFTYTVLATNNTTGCTALMSGNAIITILPPPVAYQVTGGGPYPFGGAGSQIGLLHGDVGISYQLHCNNAPVGSAISGTGSQINFGYQTQVGTYTVVATNMVTGCTAIMLGSVDITILPLPIVFNVIGGGTICEGQPGLPVTLTGSESGINYQLLRNGFPYGAIIAGTSLPLTWNSLSLGGMYEVRAINPINSITQMMQDSAVIVINPAPTVFTINPVGSQCPGTIIRLNGSELGVEYSLMLNGITISMIPGTGVVGFLDFGPQFTNGTYTIRAVNSTTGCQAMMTGSTYINVLPQVFNVIPAGILCPGQVISLSGSEAGVNYQLRWNGTFDLGAPVPGTGAAISLGTAGMPGIYTVVAIHGTTNCVVYMNGSATLYPDPTVFNIIPNGAACEGDVIGLNGSQPGVNYVLILDNAIHIDTIPGTGGPINFGPQLTEGNYTILAVDQTSYCQFAMSGTTVMTDGPIKYSLQPSGLQCIGTNVGLSGSQAGVSYQLMFNNLFTMGPAVAGTGGPISFGPQSLSGVYTVRAVNSLTGCNAWMTDSTILNPVPVVFNIAPAGSYCAGESIGLNGSELNISYILVLNGSINIDTIAGTGSAVNFGSQATAGTYTVVAYNAGTFCTGNMSGTTIIKPLPLVYDMNPGGIVCAGTTLGITNSETGVNYQLRRNGVFNVGPQVAGTGAPINFGIQTVPGTYTVEAVGANGCTVNMNGTVVINSLPVLFTQQPAGNHCPGTAITLNGSETGMNYLLYRDGAILVATLAGTGSTLNFGAQMIAGTYTISAVSVAASCQAAMNGSTVILTGPTAFNVTPAGIICSGSTIGLDNSETGVNYQLRRDGITNIGSAVAGTGSAISFGVVNIPGIYTIIATSTVTGCAATMNGMSQLHTLPLVYTLAPQGMQCSGTSITLNGSQPGTDYILLLDNVFRIDTISGTGGVIDFGPQLITGIYTIIAVNGTSTCQAVMTGSTQITGKPANFNITPAGLTCATAIVGLDGSETGINYTLFKNAVNTGITLVGTGNAIFFGIQNSGTYTVKAVNQISGCSIFMTGSLLISSPPVVNAGADITICANQSAMLNASVSLGATTLWSTEGDGTFSTNSSLVSIYTPGASDILAGSVNLILTANGVGSCSATQTSDTLLVTIDQLATANAGGNINVCLANNYTVSGATATNYTAISWTSSGTGTLTNENTLTPTYTPSAADLLAGSVTLTMMVTGNSPCSNVAIDMIMMIFNPMVSVNAGPDNTICGGTVFTITAASASNYQGVSWSTTGTGTFLGGNTINATYQPSAADILSGSTSLILTAASIAPCSVNVKDTMLLTYVPAPVSNAGADVSVCENTSLSITDASVANSTSLSWSSSGTGTFSNNAIVNPIYIPSAADIAGGSVTLVLTVNGNALCAPAIDNKIVTFILNPLVNAGPDANMCDGPFILSGATSTNCASVLWTIQSGSGTIANANSLNPTYTPSAIDLLNGFVILRITGSPISPCTGTVTDDIMLTIDQYPLANAGADIASCFNTAFTVNDASASLYTNLIWTSLGTGTFVNETTLNPTYTPSAADITNGSVTLKLTASNSGCGLVSDNKIISFINLINVNAGPDLILCEGSNVTIGGASATAYSSISWTSSGTGTFANSNTLSPTYTPSAADIANGTVTLSLNAVSLAPCNNIVSDQAIVTINKMPVVWAGNDVQLCSTSTYSNSDATILNSTTFAWTTSGDGIFSNPNILNNIYTPGAADITNGSVTLTLTSGNNAPCPVVSDQKVISIVTGPTVDAGPGAIVCTSCSFVITAATTQNSNAVLWTSAGTGTFSNASNLNTTYFPSAYDYAQGSVTLSLTAFSNPPCTQVSDQMTLTFSNNAGIDFTWGASCNAQPVDFYVNTTVTNAGAVATWLWNFGDGGTSSLMNPTHQFAGIGEYTVTLTAIDTSGIARVISKTVTVSQLPVSLFSYSTPNCSNEDVQFTDLAHTLYGYITEWVWNFGDGTIDTISFPDEPNMGHKYNAAGTFNVSLTVTNSFGCKHMVTIPVPVILAPVANFQYTNNCSGVETSFTDASYANGTGNTVQYWWNFGDPATGIDNTSTLKDATHVFSAPGTYQVMHVIRNFNNCTDTIIKPVTILTPVPVDFLYDNTCVNGSTNFYPNTAIMNVADITNWAWDFGDGITSNQQNTVHNYATSGSYKVTLTVTDLQGCTVSKTRTVVINPLPVAMFNTPAIPCVNAPVLFDDVSASYTGFIAQWTWDFGDGTTQQVLHPANPDVLHLYAAPGTYSVKLSIVSSDSCKAERTQNVVILPAPVANFDFANTCQGSAVQFTNLTQTGGTGTMTGWAWNFGDAASGVNNTSTLQNPTHTYAATGTYQVTLTVSTANGCSSTLVKTVTITAAPYVEFTYDNSCVSSSTQFTPSTSINFANVASWNWSFGNGATSSVPNPTYTYTTPGTYIVTLTITNNEGCQSSISHSITIVPAPVANFSTSTPACSQQQVYFTNQSSAPLGYIMRWEYNFGDGTTMVVNYPANPNVSHTYSTYGTFNVSLTVVTNDSCSATRTRSVEILQSPLANFYYTNTCAGQPVQFNDISQGNLISWSWNFGDSGSGSSNISTLQNPVHTYQQAGNYVVTLLIQNANNCIDTVMQTVTIAPKPVVNFAVNNGCAADTVQFISSTYVNVANTASWFWQFGDNTTSTDADPYHVYATPGTYSVTLTITSQNGCTNLKTRQVQVTTPPIALFNSNSASCSGTAVLFTDLSSTPNGIISTWNWDFGDGTFITVNAPSNPNVSHTYSTSGIFDVVLSIQTTTGCEAYYTRSITINNAPVSAFSFAGGCNQFPTFFTDLSQAASSNIIISWNWQFGDPISGVNNTSNLQNPQHTFSGPGTYNVSLTTGNAAGCTNTVMQTVTITPKPAVDFTVSASCATIPVLFSADPVVTNITDVASYLWDFGDGSIPSTLSEPEHLYAQPGNYSVTLTITNNAGCQNSITRTISIYALPVAQFSSSGNCAGNLVQFTDMSYNPGGQTIVGWMWDFGVSTASDDTSSLQNPNYSYATAGTYNVTLTVTNAAGCTSVKVMPVVVIPAPTAQYSYIAEPCRNGSVLFFDESVSAQSPVTGWYWEFAPGNYTTLQNPVHVFGATDSCYNVKLIVTTANGCKSTIIKEVCVPSGLKVDLNYTQTCFGESTWFTSTLVQPAGGTIAFYNWNFGDPATGIDNTSKLANPKHTFSKPGTFVVSLQATDVNNCISTTYMTIKVDAKPVAAFSSKGGHCDGNVYFTDLTTGAPIAQWTWIFGDGTTKTIDAPGSPDGNHYYQYPAVYEVTLITVSEAGCIDSITRTIRRTPCITAEFAVNDTIVCQKRTMKFSEASTCQAPIASWQWFFGDGTSATFTNAQPFVEHTYTAPGNYTVQMVVATQMVGGMVTDTASKQVNVKPAATANFRWQDACIGNTTEFDNLTKNNNTTISGYNWSFGDAASSNDNSTTKNPEYTYGTFGEYDVKLVVTNTLGCTDTIVNKVHIFENPVADFNWNSSCEARPVNFTDNSDSTSSAIVNWNWVFRNGDEVLGASTKRNTSYSFAQAGIYDADLKITDRNGCSTTVNKQVAINSSPVAAFNIAENFENIQGQIQMNNGTINGTSYEWDFGNGKTSYAKDPVVTFEKEGRYMIQLITSNGQDCSDTLVMAYNLLYKGLFVPNAFNPGHMNPEVAVFRPKGTNLKTYYIEIRDRWGNLLWSSTKLDSQGSPSESWDGTIHGELLKQDVYLWKISAQFKDGEIWDGSNAGNNENMPQSKAGTVTLIR